MWQEQRGGAAAIEPPTGGFGGRAPLHETDVARQPDWFADALTVVEKGSVHLGRRRGRVLAIVQWADTHVVALVRRRSLGAAAAVAAVVGIVTVSPKIFIEHDTAAAVVYSFVVSACAFFAFTVVVGARLNLVERRHAHASLGVNLVVAAALCVELTMTFRSSLWWLIGSTDAIFLRYPEIALA
jgi:hypothetical protein